MCTRKCPGGSTYQFSEANAGGYASAAQVELQISSAFTSINGFDEALVAQQRTSRHYDLVALF